MRALCRKAMDHFGEAFDFFSLRAATSRWKAQATITSACGTRSRASASLLRTCTMTGGVLREGVHRNDASAGHRLGAVRARLHTRAGALHRRRLQHGNLSSCQSTTTPMARTSPHTLCARLSRWNTLCPLSPPREKQQAVHVSLNRDSCAGTIHGPLQGPMWCWDEGYPCSVKLETV